MADKSIINSVITSAAIAVLMGVAYYAVVLKNLDTDPPLQEQVRKNTRDTALNRKEIVEIKKADKENYADIKKSATEMQEKTLRRFDAILLEQHQTRIEGAKERKELSKQMAKALLKAVKNETNIKNTSERLREYRSLERKR
ncbi:unnamed protein product [marine sediment metagenome]|uniref:Uncharacterized protein n=1 Tax=marine sediment metagenome TaxID=412755 RepID=X1BZN9_9ZZZZ